jgi:SAM-dependent methyltransferase
VPGAQVTARPPEAGPSWSERAGLDPLAAVIDPNDTDGGKNRLIDAVHKRALASALPTLRGRRVLDFGAGTGRISTWAAGQGADVVAVDPTTEMAHVVASLGLPVVVGSERLPIRTAAVDVAISVYVLQYFASAVDVLAPVVAELARTLRPQGHVAMVEQVTEADLGRGGPLAVYLDACEAAGLYVVAERPLRTSASHLLARHARLPAVLDALSARLLGIEAQRRAAADVRTGGYADWLIVARNAVPG